MREALPLLPNREEGPERQKPFQKLMLGPRRRLSGLHPPYTGNLMTGVQTQWGEVPRAPKLTIQAHSWILSHPHPQLPGNMPEFSSFMWEHPPDIR